MARRKSRKSEPDTQERNKGPVFRDGAEDVARIDRYAEYLKLQQRADGMSHEQYLAELEKIMEEGDGFDKGDTSYGEAGPGYAEADTAPNEAEIRDSLDAERERLGEGAEHPNGAGTMLVNPDAPLQGPGAARGTTSVTGPSAEDDELRDGVEDGQYGPEEEATDGQAEEGEMIEPDEAYAASAGVGVAHGGDGAGYEGVPGDGPEDSGLDAEDGTTLEDGTVQASEDGSIQDAEDSMVLDAEDGTVPEAGAVPEYGTAPETGTVPEDGIVPEEGAEDASLEDGVVPEGTGQAAMEDEADAPDVPEEQDAPDGPALQDAAPVHGAAVEDDDEYQQAQGGTHEETVTVGGHVEVHEEQYQVHDILDEISVGTGLASSVETAEYVPPRDVTVEVPNAPEAQKQPEYERSALAQRVIEMDEARQAQAQPEGPSGPNY